jgi:RNA polymerase sigma-70 factor, ECF subfamily
VDTALSKRADLDPSVPPEPVPPVPIDQQSTAAQNSTTRLAGLPPNLIQELWRTAEAETCGLTMEEFSTALTSIGAKANCGLPPGSLPDPAQKAAFFLSLHLVELALAHSCALGHEAAWEIFLRRYRASLVQTAISITGSATLGQDLAGSLYAELYGLRQTEGERRSPLASYSGRGSLMGWLRTTLVQRFRDHHRRTHRETPLDDLDSPSPAPTISAPANLSQLSTAVARTLYGIAAEDRFLLSAYYLDRQTLLQIAQTLAVHEATVSRRLKRLADNLRKQLIENLILGGLSKAAAHEALGTDPRDVEINLRNLLQTSQTSAFSNKTGSATAINPTNPIDPI